MGRPPDIDFGFEWDDRKIWALDVPVEEILLRELESNLDIMYLDAEETDDWNLALRELIENPQKHPSHLAKIQSVQMEYPIAIYHFHGSWKILDGVHRYCRALLEGRKSIGVKKISDAMVFKILKTRNSSTPSP